MNCSVTGQEKCDLLIQMIANRGDCMGRFDSILNIILYAPINRPLGSVGFL
jgi:hypothetical protein